MIDLPVQFANVREDPEVEAALLLPTDRKVLMIASAGCTALALAPRFPDCRFHLLDPNPAQLKLVKDKVAALEALAPEAEPERTVFNIGDPSAEGLGGRGNFEALFRAFGGFLDELVLSRSDRIRGFHDASARGSALPYAGSMAGHRFWPVAFDLFFSDSILNTMFGPAATQHAAGSYARYFQAAIERGMNREDAGKNPWLAQVLLGCFLPQALAPWIARPVPPESGQLTLIEGTLDAVADLGDFDLVQLSNILDWMAPDEGQALCSRLATEMKPGARLLIRQLNSDADLGAWLGDAFAFDEPTASRLLAADRSLFYSRLCIATRGA